MGSSGPFHSWSGQMGPTYDRESLMSTILQHMTADELADTPGLGRCELIRGELVHMSPAGGEHGWTIAKLTAKLVVFVEQHRLGFVFGAETGFVIERDPDTVRAPDVSFVRSGRITTRPTRKFLPFAPDLAVEVISPSDSSTKVSAKAEQWLRCGTTTVWLIDPVRDSAAVCVLEDDVFVLRAVTELADAELLPGFVLPVKSLFE